MKNKNGLPITSKYELAVQRDVIKREAHRVDGGRARNVDVEGVVCNSRLTKANKGIGVGDLHNHVQTQGHGRICTQKYRREGQRAKDNVAVESDAEIKGVEGARKLSAIGNCAKNCHVDLVAVNHVDVDRGHVDASVVELGSGNLLACALG